MLFPHAYAEAVARDLRGGLRPPGTGPHEVVALEQPFPVCGKLKPVRLWLRETGQG